MNIYKELPKDIKYIVNDYLKDKENYEKCLDEMIKRMSRSACLIHVSYHLPMFLSDNKLLDIIMNKHNAKVYNEFISETLDKYGLEYAMRF
jgi:hypothetical protein